MPLIVGPRRQALNRWPFRLNTQSPQARGLVAWLPLQDAGLEAFTVDGAVRYPASEINPWTYQRKMRTMADGGGMTGADFNGSEFVYFDPITLPQTSPFSICCWAVMDSGAAAQEFMGIHDISGGQNAAWLEQAVTWNFVTRTAGPTFAQATGASATEIGTLVHLCGVQNTSTDRRIYVNGVQSGTTNTDTNNPTGFDSITIATRAEVNNLNGSLADVRVYNRGLTATDLAPIVAQRTRYDLFAPTTRRVFFHQSTPVGAKIIFKNRDYV